MLGGNSTNAPTINASTGSLDAPSAPTSLSANATGWAEVVLTWIDNSTLEDGFHIDRKISGGPFTEVATVGPNVTTYTDGSGLTASTAYEYRVRAYNASGEASSNTDGATTTTVGQSYGFGAIRWDVWYSIEGNPVSQLTNDPRFPNEPDSSSSRSKLQGPTNIADNYGTRMLGWVYPPTSGNYTFWVSSDNASALYISTNSSSSNKVKIAEVGGNGYTSPLQWTKYASQKSVPINLVAGNKYYIEVLHKAGGGGDHVAVAWDGPGFGQEVIDGANLEPEGDFCGVNLSAESLSFTTAQATKM
ncbi:MAG: hypothetical protein HC896_08720 [Bacteroidales bacterium]|nr:hypothetical protein [Bacteroidales bacterium]